MPKIQEVDVGGVTGQGRTKTEARADAHAKIERWLEGDYSPVHLSCQGVQALVWREPRLGWMYRILRPERVEVAREWCEQLHGISSGAQTTSKQKTDTLRRARLHMAQNIFRPDKFTGLKAILNEADRREHASWVVWQYNYQAWKDAGASDTNAHERASYHRWPDDATIYESREVNGTWLVGYILNDHWYPHGSFPPPALRPRFAVPT